MMLARMKDLDDSASIELMREAERRPWRWRAPARLFLASQGRMTDGRARVLESIGEVGDVRAT
jgi:hypothetical protein